MKTHPMIPGDPIVLFFFESGCSRCVTTWARSTDAPGWSAIRAGIPPTAKPLAPGYLWYPLVTEAQRLIEQVVAQHPDHLLDFLLPYDGPTPKERESVEGDPRYEGSTGEEDGLEGR